MFITLLGGTEREGNHVFDVIHGAFGGRSKMRITLTRSGPGWAITDCQTFPDEKNCAEDIASALRAAGIATISLHQPAQQP